MFHQNVPGHGKGRMVSIHRHQVGFGLLCSSDLQHPVDGIGGQTGPILHPAEPPFSNSRGNLPVFIEACPCIVIVVNPQDDHSVPLLISFKAASTGAYVPRETTWPGGPASSSGDRVLRPSQ